MDKKYLGNHVLQIYSKIYYLINENEKMLVSEEVKNVEEKILENNQEMNKDNEKLKEFIDENIKNDNSNIFIVIKD